MARRSGLLAGLILLAPVPPATAATPGEAEPAAAIERGVATLRIESRQIALPYTRTVAGPLFALAPVAARLGGTLEPGTLRQYYQLTLAGKTFVFGPGSSALTSDGEIIELSQPPQIGNGGVQVPLDLLRQTLGNYLGFDFYWLPEGGVLAAARQTLREIPVVLDVVNLQGVTTLVLRFPTPPRYQIHRSPSRVEVELLGDRLEVTSPRLFAADDLVRDIRMTPERILIELAAGAAAQSYVLQEPFRLVFDVIRDPGKAPAGEPSRLPPRRRQRRTGIRTIVLDPGHGGQDTGAIGPGGAQEKDITLDLARALQRRLASQLPVKVVLTRSGDEDLALDSRSALANQAKGDLFISLHVNASMDSGAAGSETYFSSLEASDEAAARAAASENRGLGDPLYDLQLILWDLAQSHYLAASQRLAGLVQDELNSALSLRNRGVKQAPFRVLLGAAMPAVLVELGFLSNPAEERRLEEAAYRDQLVAALGRAVSRFRAQSAPTVGDDDEAAGR